MNNENAKLLAALLSRLAKEISALNDEELRKLTRNSRPLLQITSQPLRASETPKKGRASSHTDISTIIRNLRALNSREAGEVLLRRETNGRSDLSKIAKAIDVPAPKGHTSDQIIETIVDATIGFRIRSAAVRGQARPQDGGE